MARFRVDEGKHIDEREVVYVKGEVIESDKNLDLLFVNKFTRVDDTTPVTRKLPPGGGAHNPHNMAAPTVRDISPEEQQRRHREPGKVAAEDQAGETEEEMAAKTAKDEASATTLRDGPLGVNVTGQFGDADKAGVQVFRSNGKFHVTDAKEPEEALNEKPLTKREAQDFVETFIK